VSLENVFMQEVVRAYLRGWYADVAEGVPQLSAGRIAPDARPGHGVSLAPDLLGRPGTTVRTTS